MALPALKQASELLAVLPSIPAMPDGGSPAEFRRALNRQQRDLAEYVARRRSALIALKQLLGSSLGEFVALSNSSKEVLDQLQEAIDGADAGLTSRREFIETLGPRFSRIEKDIATKSLLESRFFRKVARRFVQLVTEEHNLTVDFYYFLLSLHADHDPGSQKAEGRVGPGDDLRAALMNTTAED